MSFGEFISMSDLWQMPRWHIAVENLFIFTTLFISFMYFYWCSPLYIFRSKN